MCAAMRVETKGNLTGCVMPRANARAKLYPAMSARAHVTQHPRPFQVLLVSGLVALRTLSACPPSVIRGGDKGTP